MLPKEIASELGLSAATVKGYLDDARVKLGASNRTEAIRLLREHDEAPADGRGPLGGVGAPGLPQPQTGPTAEELVPANRVQEPPVLTGMEPATWSPGLHLPVRRRGRFNDLTTTERLLWIAAIAVAAAFATALMWLAIAAAGWAIRQPQ